MSDCDLYVVTFYVVLGIESTTSLASTPSGLSTPDLLDIRKRVLYTHVSLRFCFVSAGVFIYSVIIL